MKHSFLFFQTLNSIGGLIVGALTSSPMFVLFFCCAILYCLRTCVTKAYHLLLDGLSWIRDKLGCSGYSDSSYCSSNISIQGAECVLLEGICHKNGGESTNPIKNLIYLPVWFWYYHLDIVDFLDFPKLIPFWLWSDNVYWH